MIKCMLVLVFTEVQCNLKLFSDYCCLQEYCKEPLTGSVNMIHTLCRDVEKKKSCIDVLSK